MTIVCVIELSPVWRHCALVEVSFLTPSARSQSNRSRSMIPMDVLENYPTSHLKKRSWPALGLCGGAWGDEGSQPARKRYHGGGGSKHQTYGDHGLLHPLNCRIYARDIPPTPHVPKLLDWYNLVYSFLGSLINETPEVGRNFSELNCL